MHNLEKKNTFRLSKYYKDCDHCNCIEIKPFEHDLYMCEFIQLIDTQV